MANLIYNRFLANLMNKEVDLEADVIKVQLHTSSYTPAATHNVKSDLTNEVANGNGYTTGGATLANKSVTQGATTYLDADDTTWSSSSITARYAVLVDDTLTNDDLICCFDFGQDYTSTNGNFTIQWNASGLITLAQA